MNLSEKPLDLDLWLDKSVIQRQNLLNAEFTAILEEVGNEITPSLLQQVTPSSRGIKLSRGNDLLGFPYLVLDLIRDFDPVNGVNIRLLNWFGHGFFIAILLGELKNNPIDQIINYGFSYGLSERKWDYPDLIVNQNLSVNRLQIEACHLGFHHWIKKLTPHSNPKVQVESLVTEIKKILRILSLPT